MNMDLLHRKLQQLIGDRFDYLGEVWVMIEVLADVDSVVLKRCRDCQPGSVQRDVYGFATRRTVNTLSLKISDADGDGYSEDLLVLLEGRQSWTEG